jgi:hypothetical protein
MRSARRGPPASRNRKTGRSLSVEEKVWSQPTGACGCFGMKIFVRLPGERFRHSLRSATESVHRDIFC